MFGFADIALAQPWLLLGLAAVPVIWWLLRVTPPRPANLTFPPIRILRELQQERETPATTPLWLTLLRMLLAALAVLALAQPLLNPKQQLAGDGHLLLVVDNGWAAAPGWEKRQDAMADLLLRAERAARTVRVLATAPPADDSGVRLSEPLPAARARELVRNLAPLPWGNDPSAAVAALREARFADPPQIFWLSDGLNHGGSGNLAVALTGLGELTVLRPLEGNIPPALLPGDGSRVDQARLLRAGGAEKSYWVRALAGQGQVLGRVRATFPPGDGLTTVAMDLPAALANKIERLEIEGVSSAAAVVLLDERWQRRSVGLISGDASEKRAQPLLSHLHYLEKALSPHADLYEGQIAELLDQSLSMLILADIGRLPRNELDALTKWVESGGTLVRFAGPHLAEGADDLVPVRLRTGERALGGALSWSEPAKLAPFADNSPFQGLPIPEDVVVYRQVLAQPSLDLSARTWARLSDGTPLVTAERRERGHIVLFHTTANADWSNLPISGLFPSMLQRLTRLARGGGQAEGKTALPPLLTLNGAGELGPPGPWTEPADSANWHKLIPGPKLAPGYYGSASSRRALNLTASWRELKPLPELPAGAKLASFEVAPEIDLKPWLLAAAIALALLDLVATMALRGVLLPRRAGRAAALILLAALIGAGPDPVRAQQQGKTSNEEFAIAATTATRLAYVITGDRRIDETSRAGLTGLSRIIKKRTSVEPEAPMPVNIEQDELALFPLLYWPIAETQPRLSETAIARLGRFMRTGGTIFFDTRDGGSAGRNLTRAGRLSPAGARLQKLLRRLDVPPLIPVPHNHVLTKAFYLLQDFPGRRRGAELWVERRRSGINDGVSSLIIGANDWAAAWAVDTAGRPMFAVIPGGERQREIAYRVGINMIMYTLTGNYKADQVHVPAILERLGQ